MSTIAGHGLSSFASQVFMTLAFSCCVSRVCHAATPQKNWMLAMPLFMVAMNLLGNQLGGAASGAREREQARQGAPAGGGRANARGR